MTRYIIDRFEEEAAICETESGQRITILRKALPDNVKEGDVLVEEGSRLSIDTLETECRQYRIKDKLNRLWKRDENV